MRDIALGPDGALWAVRGLAHMGLTAGQLFRHDAQGWKLIASASGFRLPDSPFAGQCAGDWNLPYTTFDSIAFDASGRVLLSTETLGVVRREPTATGHASPRNKPRVVAGDALAIRGLGAARNRGT